MTNSLVRMTKWLGYTVAVFIIFYATMISISRLLTPYLNEHKPALELWAGKLLGVTVTIQQVKVSWDYYYPELTLASVKIIDTDTRKPTFHIKQLAIRLKMLDSLLRLSPVLSYIKMSGVDLTIREKKPGEFSVTGLGNFSITDDITGSTDEANEIVAWIFAQPALVLEDIDIQFFTQAGVKKIIHLAELSLLNHGSKHALSGKAMLQQTIPLGVQLGLEWKGDSFDPAAIEAKLYLYLEAISLPQWFEKVAWKNIQLKEGVGSAKCWINWNKGQIDEIQSQLTVYDLSLHSMLTDKTQNISRFSGHFGWKRQGSEQIVAGNDILIDLPHHLWPTTSFSLKLPIDNDTASTTAANEGQPLKLDQLGLGKKLEWFFSHMPLDQKPWSLSVAYLDIGDVRDVALFSGLLSQDVVEKLVAWKPSGAVTHLSLALRDRENIKNNPLSASFVGLSWQSQANYPGVKGLSGFVEWDGQKGQFIVASKKMMVTDDRLFSYPVVFNQASGIVAIQAKQSHAWEVDVTKLNMLNDDLDVNAKAKLSWKEGASPLVDIKTEMAFHHVEHLIHYLPLKKMDTELAHWLEQAFLAGNIASGKLLLNGNMADFPFEEGNGTFEFRATVKDFDLHFAPNWPLLEDANGDIAFVRRNMSFLIRSGSLHGIALENVTGEIPYIGPNHPQLLKINGVIAGDAAAGIRFIHDAPLEKTLGKRLEGLQLSGPIELTLGLQIPIKFPEKTLVSGDLRLDDAVLTLPSWSVKVDDLKGSVHFTEQSIAANNVQGKLFDESTRITLATVQAKDTLPFIKVDVWGRISSAFIQSLAGKNPFAKMLQGETAYTAELDLVANESSQPNVVTVKTLFKGMALDLPGGFAKKSEEIVPSTIVAYLAQQKPINIQWRYGDKFSTAVTLNKSNEGLSFYGGELRLGGKQQANFQKKPGLLISGEFDMLDWNTWKSYAGFTAQQTKPTAPSEEAQLLSTVFRGVDVQAKKIVGLFQTLNNVTLQLEKSSTAWLVKIASKEVGGVVTIPNDLKKEPIQADLSYLTLEPAAGTQHSIDPASLPSIVFRAQEVRYQDKRLGLVAFTLSSLPHGVSIDSLRIEGSSYLFSASGEWLSENQANQTHLKGKLQTSDVASFLSEWGSKTVNPVGCSGNVLLDLHWPGTPYAPVVAGIAGSLDLHLGAGSIVNLDQSTQAKMGIGRLLNLLSLESISRALTLDFRQLTEKGFGFDSIKGHFALREGSAFTDEARIDGSIARIEMNGRIGYVAKDYDIRLSVTPYVTGSIPVVAAIAVNPVIGIAAWAVEKIAGRAVSSVTTRHYAITGTWDQPVWNEKNK